MNNIDKYINYINTVLINKNIDNEITDWKNNKELYLLSETTNEIYMSDSIALGIDANELIYFIKINSEMVDDNIISKIKKDIEERTQQIINNPITEQKEETFQAINLLFFVSSIHARITLKNAFSSKKALELTKKIRAITNTNAKSFKFFPMFYLDRTISEEEIKLPNIRRYEMVTLPSPFDADIEVCNDTENKSCALKGYIFTANLFDLVSLYNTIGDQLFKKNVRLGIEDTLEVDKSIKETLTNNPEAFWFRNNGITILVEEPLMKLDRVNEIILKEPGHSDLKFSVINGAQTITAAAEYYYSLSSKDRAEQSLQAQVIVKIIHIRDKNTTNATKEAKTISIALNRQKPIKSEDIAFTDEFVETMNDYLRASKAPYTLVRRGEEFSTNNKAYSLINFAKARKACAGDPGAARSNATSSLLKINPKTSRFNDQEIFNQEWYSVSENDREELYKTFYSPVPFAIDMSAICQSIVKKVQRTDAIGNIMKNGLWYFIAYVVYLLNDGDDKNYAHFTYDVDKVSLEAFKELFEEFAKFYCEKLNADVSSTNSNTFKTSDSYKKLKDCAYEKSLFYQNVCKLFGKKISIPLDTTIRKPSHTQSSSQSIAVQVIYNGVSYNASNITEAFIYTVQQCLEKSSIDKYIIALETLPFLTRNVALNSGKFRKKTSVTIKEEPIYIGKQSNSTEKINQLKRLCDVLHIEDHTILWKKEDSIIFEY